MIGGRKVGSNGSSSRISEFEYFYTRQHARLIDEASFWTNKRPRQLHALDAITVAMTRSPTYWTESPERSSVGTGAQGRCRDSARRRERPVARNGRRVPRIPAPRRRALHQHQVLEVPGRDVSANERDQLWRFAGTGEEGSQVVWLIGFLFR